MASETSKHKLDLFKDVLPAIYRGDMNYYSNLSDEDKKSLTPVTLMRWLSTSKTQTQAQIEMVNFLVNKKYNALYNEPELMWKLLVMSTMDLRTNGRIPNHEWISAPKRKNNLSKLEKTILEINPSYNDMELDMIVESVTQDDYKQILKDQGFDDKVIKEHIADFKKHHDK